MSIEIRQATPSDRDKARERWIRILEPPKSDKDPIFGSMHRVPGSGNRMAPYLWRVASKAIVNDMMARCAILVAVHPSVPDEIVGWVASEGDRLHMVYVLGPARRRGVGRALVERAMGGRRPRPTYCNSEGKLFLKELARTTACGDTSTNASARPHEDAARGRQDVVDC